MGPPQNCVVRTFLVATSKRDRIKYPHPSNFTYDLPLTMHNIVGMAIRDFKFGEEFLINENNKTLTVNINGTISHFAIPIGNYANNVTQLINALNIALNSCDLTFSIDTISGNRVKVVYGGSSYVVIHPTSILRIIGFPEGKSGGLCMYAGSPPENVSGYMGGIVFVMPDNYDMYNLSEMVVRISDVETILSNDPITNRCTAVLFNSNSTSYVVKQCLDHYIPLLQQQQRLQSLRIQLFNMEGELYDTINNEAVLLLEFYCIPQNDA